MALFQVTSTCKDDFARFITVLLIRALSDQVYIMYHVFVFLTVSFQLRLICESDLHISSSKGEAHRIKHF